MICGIFLLSVTYLTISDYGKISIPDNLNLASIIDIISHLQELNIGFLASQYSADIHNRKTPL